MIRIMLLVCLFVRTTLLALAISPEATQHLQAGIAAEKQRNFAVAIGEFRKVTELEPDDPTGFVRLANAYMENHQYGDAVRPLNKVLENNSELPVAHQLLGYALLAQGNAAGAIPHLEKVHELGALGIAQLQTGRASEAVTNLQAALAKMPSDPDLLYYVSQAGEMLSQQSLDALLSSSPNSARAHQAKAHNFYVLHQFPQAENEYQQALALRPDIPGLHLELGQVYAADSQLPKAEEQFLAETQLQPAGAEAAFRLGDVWLQEGKPKDALKMLKQADTLRPDISDTLYSLGKAAVLVGDTSTAEHALSRVIVLENDSPLAGQAHYSLAGVYRKQGKAAEAEHEMQEFHRLQGGNKP
jgi:tetratricopeptide (TPR) repeat protein